MTETKNAATENGLFAALAKLQQQMPVVGKGQEGEVKGEKDGRHYAYKYRYADLTTVAAALYPLMGKLGLAFTAKPTINANGQFVLAYKLVHGPSGEKDEGEYLLPSPERTKPQQLGSFISYARRYSLCAVTGCAPGGDDDDAQSAQQVHEDDWHNRPVVNRRERQEPAQDASPAQWETPPAEPETDTDWMSDLVDTKIPAATDQATLNKYWHESVEMHKQGKCTAEHGKQIQAEITKRAHVLGVPQKAKEAKAQADSASNGKTPEPVPS